MNRDSLKLLNEVNLSDRKSIKIQNLSNFETNSGTIDIIRHKINLLLSSLSESLCNSKQIFRFSENENFESFDQIVDIFGKESTKICKFAKYTSLFEK